MTRIATSLQLAHWKLALLGGLTALLLGALPASAQDVCASLEDVSEEALDLYLDQLDDDFEVDLNDDELCSSLTDNFVKGCLKAVKDAVKCVQSQIKVLAKQGDLACKGLAGPFTAECVAEQKEEAKNGDAAVKSIGEDLSAECEDDLAFDYFDVCMFGF